MSYKNGQSYEEHFEWLKDKHITNRPRACCCICGNRNKHQLTLHHEVYDPWKEKLHKHLFIVCKYEGKCHTAIHHVSLITRKIRLHQELWKLRRLQLRWRYIFIKYVRSGTMKVWTRLIQTNISSTR